MRKFLSRSRLPGLAFLAAAFGSTTAGALAQVIGSLQARPFASCIVVPQSRVFVTTSPAAAGIEITGVDAAVAIVQQASTTTLDISLRNPGPTRREAELVVPVPDDAVVRGFTFQGAAAEPTAQVLPKDQARRIYESIVAQVRDPALLEFIGYNLIRSSVFPVEAGGTQTVRLIYEHLLPADGDRVDYVLPRSESLEYAVPWTISVEIRSKQSISTVYSPSHAIDTLRTSDSVVTVRTPPSAGREPGSFRLSYLVQRDGVNASLFAYPDPKVGGGYFLLLAGPPARPAPASEAEGIRREVTLVLDRSGSMSGEKIEQVREAAKQIIAGLEAGENFNILAYSNSVDLLAPQPVVKSKETEAQARAYLDAVRAGGGTNIHDALVEALRQPPTPGTLPIVLFLTDGLPTVGQTSEVAIREIATKGNRFERRIFTFGVGVDVNTPLLDKIAVATRASATFVLPREDVEVKVASVFRRLSGPVLASPRLETIGPDGAVVAHRVFELQPAKLPDLFEGDQLVVLGKYRGEYELRFRLAGNYLGKERTFQFQFGLDKSTTRHAFVPRLWASRQIAVLIEAIRELGANGGPAAASTSAGAQPPSDPRLRELVDEIVRLSTEFGILTEYTAFLAHEGTDLTRRNLLVQLACDNCQKRAVVARSGVASVNQEVNKGKLQNQNRLDYKNRYLDDTMTAVEVATVQQVNDLAFYFRANGWIDSRLVAAGDKTQVTRTVQFASPEFFDLARRLASEGRQGSIALRGDVLLEVDGKAVLVKGPVEADTAPAEARQGAAQTEGRTP
jgi:Ca-activated chloride channel family protein